MKNIIYKLTVAGIVSEHILNLTFRDFDNKNFPEFLLSLFCLYSEYDIAVGTDFNRLINTRNQKSFDIQVTLFRVSQQWGLPFGYVPIGHKTICQFKISQQDLYSLQNIFPIINSWDEADNLYELIYSK